MSVTDTELPDNATLQYDQFARYTVVSEILRSCFEAGEPNLLDVGAGPSELTPRFLAGFYKERVSTDVEGFGLNDIVVVPPGAPLPYDDRHFSAAIAMDVLEHVKPEHRDLFITEMIRVSRVAVIGTPIGCDQTRLAESFYQAGYRDLYDKPLTFLDEHTAYGLPVSDDVLVVGKRVGAHCFATDCAPLDEWLASNIIDLYLSTVNDGYRLKGFISQKMNQSLPLRRPGARHYRRFYIFTRDEGLAQRLAKLPAPSQPADEPWNGRGAQLIMARLFRDYAAVYDAPFVDEERQALQEKDRHIAGLTALIRRAPVDAAAEADAIQHELAAVAAERDALRHRLDAVIVVQDVTQRELLATTAERNEVKARLAAFAAKPLFRRLGAALRNAR